MEEVLDDLEEGGEVDKVAVKKAMSTALKHAESFLDALLEVKKSLGEASDDDSIEDGDEMDLEDGNEDEEEILETPEVEETRDLDSKKHTITLTDKDGNKMTVDKRFFELMFGDMPSKSDFQRMEADLAALRQDFEASKTRGSGAPAPKA